MPRTETRAARYQITRVIRRSVPRRRPDREDVQHISVISNPRNQVIALMADSARDSEPRSAESIRIASNATSTRARKHNAPYFLRAITREELALQIPSRIEARAVYIYLLVFTRSSTNTRTPTRE